MGIHRRKDDRHGAHEPVLAAAQHGRADLLHFSGGLIEARRFAAIDQVGIQRIRRDVTVFFDAHRMPLAKGDLGRSRSGCNAGRTALLLAAVNPVRKLIVGDHVIELRGGLVVPGTPGLAAVDADGGALVAGEQDDARIFGIDPDGVVIVATRRAFYCGERCPASVERYVDVLAT